MYATITNRKKYILCNYVKYNKLYYDDINNKETQYYATCKRSLPVLFDFSIESALKTIKTRLTTILTTSSCSNASCKRKSLSKLVKCVASS